MPRAAEGSRVAVLGASPKEDRFSFKAVRMLKEHGHNPIPVHPAGHTVDGVQGVKSLDDVEQGIDTLTIYVNPNISGGQLEKMMALKPRRIVFNPGTENPELAAKLKAAGIEVVESCTLVMLRSEEF